VSSLLDMGKGMSVFSAKHGEMGVFSARRGKWMMSSLLDMGKWVSSLLDMGKWASVFSARYGEMGECLLC
jgi:hypothetical protein